MNVKTRADVLMNAVMQKSTNTIPNYLSGYLLHLTALHPRARYHFSVHPIHSHILHIGTCRADLLGLRRQSKSLGRCWDVLKVVSCFQSSLWASPHRPTQCSKTGLKMSDWKWEILTEPSNGQDSYSASQEQGYLVGNSAFK